MLMVFSKIRSAFCALALLFLLFSPVVFAADSNSKAVKADNSGVNQNDYEKGSLEKRKLTPEDQAWGSKSDVEMTRQIREELMKDKSLSIYAQNVKIITIKGIVHLRGPVHTQAEKDRIALLAKDVAGSKSVQNEIEIKGE